MPEKQFYKEKIVYLSAVPTHGKLVVRSFGAPDWTLTSWQVTIGNNLNSIFPQSTLWVSAGGLSSLLIAGKQKSRRAVIDFIA